MKKTLIALMALAGVAAADDTVTLKPLEGDWTTGSRSGRPTWTKDDAGALTLTNSNWSQAYAIYDLSTNATGAWDFEATVARYTGEAGFTLTLVGNTQAITIGIKDYTDGSAYYGTTTNVTANGYSFKDSLGDIGGTQVTSSTKGAESAFNYSQSASISASTALDADSNVILTLTLGGSAVSTPYTTTINLGQNFVLDKIVIWGDGENNKANLAVTAMELTYTVPSAPATPEPTTATLSLLALAGMAARRRRR